MCQEKQCTKCFRFLPLGEFSKHKIKKDGLRSECRQCRAEWQRKYYEANKDKIAERQHKYNEANKDKVAEKKRKYNEANKDKIAERKRKYYEANREKIEERQRKYREANSEKIEERQRKYREAKRAETAQTAVFRGLDKNKLKELKTKLEKLEK